MNSRPHLNLFVVWTIFSPEISNACQNLQSQQGHLDGVMPFGSRLNDRIKSAYNLEKKKKINGC